MAKYGKGSWYGGHRANYQPGIGRRVRPDSSFSIKASGYSFNFISNWGEWKTFTREMKMRIANAMADELGRITRQIGIEAIKRCPHYSGALEHSIKSTIPEITSLTSRGRATATVGVLSSWSSSYDDFLKKLGGSYPMSSPELVRYIHEYYDQFITRLDDKGKPIEGYKRKLRKEAVTGEHVGSHFLTRAFYESDAGTFDAQGIIQKVKTLLHSAGAKETTEYVNAALSQEARKYDSLE